MPLKHWEKLQGKTIYSNEYWSYKLDRFEIEGGKTGEYHYVHTSGSTLIIPVTEEKKVILVNQFRYLVNRESIEFPCGSVGEGLTEEENALKELREETGYSAHTIKLAGIFAPYNGVSDELCSVYVAHNLFTAPLKGDLTEEFEVIEKSFDDINKMIEENIIWDGMSIAGWLLAKKYLQN